MIASQLEILLQARRYLSQVEPRRYTEVRRPRFQSSAGEHMRHVLDHYQAIRRGLDTGEVDYTRRRRGDAVERDPNAALTEVEQLRGWLAELAPAALERPLTVVTEVSISEQLVRRLPSSGLRELAFAGSHAVHHYAQLRQIAFEQGWRLDEAFGLAPATASHLRRSQRPLPVS